MAVTVGCQRGIETAFASFPKNRNSKVTSFAELEARTTLRKCDSAAERLDTSYTESEKEREFAIVAATHSDNVLFKPCIVKWNRFIGTNANCSRISAISELCRGSAGRIRLNDIFLRFGNTSFA